MTEDRTAVEQALPEQPPTRIRPARAGDFADVVALLKSWDLCVADLDQSLGGFFLAQREKTIVGTVGIERFGRVGFLRSLAVSRSLQNRGIGQRLFEHALDFAQSTGIDKIYLLTTTAAEYFTRQGFEPVVRSTVPVQIKETEQFKTLCPDSAIVMEKIL